MGSWLSFFHLPNDRRICRIYGHHLRQLASNRLDGTDMGSWLSFFHIPNDRRICRIYGHHQKNVLILLQCIAMWEERKIHIVPISLWLSVLYTKFHPSKKKTFFLATAMAMAVSATPVGVCLHKWEQSFFKLLLIVFYPDLCIKNERWYFNADVMQMLIVECLPHDKAIV